MKHELNQAQTQAVHHQGGPLLILAGAGSGKTRVITHRLAELLRRGVPASRILAVTFTNKAAAEVRHRTEGLLGDSNLASQLWIGTFHSICARLLRIYAGYAGLSRDFTIFDDDDQLSLIKQVLRDLDLAEHYNLPPRAIRNAIDRAKNRGETPEAYQKGRPGDYLSDLVARVYPVYQERLRASSALDFGDLLLVPILLCEEDPRFADELAGRFAHVLVDEFQDTNQVQSRLLGHLCGRSRQIFVVGDDDQAIYGWRGADVRNILRFEDDWPDAASVKLERNYRSTEVILRAANAVIGKVRDRRGKELYTEQQGGPLIVCHVAEDERREAHFVAKEIRRLVDSEGFFYGDVALLYRINAMSRTVEEVFRDYGIPYTVIGGVRFYDRAEVKDVLAYLRLVQNPADEVALRRVLNVPPRGIGEATVEKIDQRAVGAAVSFYQAIQDLLHMDGEAGLPQGAEKRLRGFFDLLEEFRRHAEEQGDLGSLCERIIERTGYLDRLSQDESHEAMARKENVLELIGSIQALCREARGEDRTLTLLEYLERVALVSPTDGQSRGVCLLTVHAAKGLEFDAVFLIGMEEGLFPSLREREERSAAEVDGEEPLGDVSEERRLCYVALTRAKTRLYLSHGRRRRLFGPFPRDTQPSRFLLEIPRDCLDEGLVVRSGQGGQPLARPPDPTERRVEYEEETSELPRKAVGRKRTTSAAPKPSPFRLGMAVSHKIFGVGEVRMIIGAGRNEKLEVHFPERGAMTVFAHFLEPLVEAKAAEADEGEGGLTREYDAEYAGEPTIHYDQGDEL